MPFDALSISPAVVVPLRRTAPNAKTPIGPTLAVLALVVVGTVASLAR